MTLHAERRRDAASDIQGSESSEAEDITLKDDKIVCVV